jgi:LmbE family N-acetylglucosaminyl deacetylase
MKIMKTTAEIKLSNPGAEIYISDGKPLGEALRRTTHLGVGAHPDDLEIMAFYGILECYGRKGRGFTGITVTHGGGDGHGEQVIETRKREQKKAARLGRYAAQLLLNHSSQSAKNPRNHEAVLDLCSILELCRPRVVYTHCLTDKHDTHVAVALRVIEALRKLPKNRRPKKLVGCEVWRGLDWMRDEDKLAMPLGENSKFAVRLMGVYQSQKVKGKHFAQAAAGRWRANAVFHEIPIQYPNRDISWGMDMTALLENPSLNPVRYARAYIDRFYKEIHMRIHRMK